MDKMINKKYERLTEAKLAKQLMEAKRDIELLQSENETLHHEISYYESLANNDPEANWPHRDGRYRDWLMKRIQDAAEGGSQ